jgi:adenylate cyclase
MAAANNSSRYLDPLWEGRVLLCTVGACLTLLAALLLFFPPKPLQQAHLRLYDAMLAGRTMQAQTSVSVLVGLDEESLTAYGQWPWPRYRLAMVVERLQKLGAEVVALDFLMPEPDRSSPEVIEFERRRDLGQRGARASPSVGDSNSDRLSEVMRRGNVVLGSYFDFSGEHETPGSLAFPASQTGMAFVSTPGSTDGWPKARGIIRSLPTLTAAASAEGFTNAVHDVDGTLRRVPLMLTHDQRIQPSLSFAALLLAAKDRAVSVVKDGAEVSVHWRHRQIPVDSAGNLMLDFRSGQPAFPYYSAKAILEGELSPGKLQGKIVFVGAWATGLGDSHLTPAGSQMYGLEAHATVIDNILAGTFISQPGWGKGAELLAVVALGIIGTLLLSRAGYVVSLVTVALLTTGCYSAARFMLLGHGLYISPLLPMLTLITITSILGMLKYGIEVRKVQHRTLELIDAQDAIIISMSALAEVRDRNTGRHILRTQRYVEILARQLCRLEKYSDLDEMTIELLGKSAPLHDIGKIGIPDSILQKPDRLTVAEYEIMKSHTLIGAEALAHILNDSGHRGQHDFLNYAMQMAISHHEWWDGSGYPYGLKGEEIPLAGRLMALADVYDALISQRSYKTSLPHEHAREQIRQRSGGQFDPDVVDAFMASNEEFYATSQSISDGRT